MQLIYITYAYINICVYIKYIYIYIVRVCDYEITHTQAICLV